jgi:hypothetical protein
LVIGFQNLILAASIKVEDPAAAQSVVSWVPEAGTRNWFKNSLPEMLKELTPPQTLAHLTLTGNFIWSRENPVRYLDGDVLGLTGGKDNLSLPSGDGRRGGIFEMWFWVIPDA